ncbi:MAG: helix-turn-helix domain-containing protein [Clostridiales bacterium]|mgnify:CR=1 FL=1|jgi:YesN/AraC family two-component response regulator|nr:helix-turn-helix domain-containing protein [Clostridiales bacterium]
MAEYLKLDKLSGLLSDFYKVTGQRIGIFDGNMSIILECPKRHSPFCERIRSSQEGTRRCRECDNYGMHEALKSGRTITYRCHAGLLEACSPIYDKDKIAGYLMFGQVIYDRNIDDQHDMIFDKCRDIIDVRSFNNLFGSIRTISPDYLDAATNIMTACVGYIQLEQLIKLQNEGLWGQMQHYIDNNADTAFTLSDMANDLAVSISTLCKTAKRYSGKSVGQLVIDLRIKRAKHLLANERNLTVSQVSAVVGIEDYNYFSRIFKKETGYSPTEYRKQAQ